MTKPRLSICIATYNRAEYIGETLKSIIPQLTDEVEIVIVDGASTDGTGDIIKRFCETCKQINYIPLPSKGGVDQDFCKAVEHAKGEYCWLFPDDDLLMPDAIKTILNESSKGYSLIVVNAQVMPLDFSKAIESQRLRIDTDEVYEGANLSQLFDRIIRYISFIGAIVINRDLWLQREKEPYFGTEFIHVGVIFQAPLPAPALVMRDPHIMIRYGNSQWTSRSTEIWLFKWPQLLSSFSHVSESVKKKYQMTRPKQRLQKIIPFRAMGVYTLNDYHKWFAPEKSSFGWKFTAFVIAITPSCLVNLGILIYFKMTELFIATMPSWLVNLCVPSYIQKKIKDQIILIYELQNNKYNIMRMLHLKH